MVRIRKFPTLLFTTLIISSFFLGAAAAEELLPLTGTRKLLCQVQGDGQGKLVKRTKSGKIRALRTGSKFPSKRKLRKLRKECTDLAQSLSNPNNPNFLRNLLSNSNGLYLGTLHGEAESPFEGIAQAMVPVSKELAPLLRESSPYGLYVTTHEGTSYTVEAEPFAFHHLEDGSAPAVLRLRFPVTATPGVNALTLHGTTRNELPETSPFRLTPAASSFLQSGSLTLRAEGPDSNTQWSAEFPASSCAELSAGIYTKTYRCERAFQPFAGQAPTALTAHIYITLESGRDFIKVESVIGNSSIGGAYDAPVKSLSLQLRSGGTPLQPFPKNADTRWTPRGLFQHQSTSDELYLVPPAEGTSLHVIPRDAILTFAETLYPLNNESATIQEVISRQESPILFVPLSEKSEFARVHNLSLLTNWHESTPLLLTRTPILHDSFSQSDIVAELETAFSRSTGPSTHNSIYNFDGAFYSHLAGLASMSTAGGVGLEGTPPFLTLATNLVTPGLGELLTGIESYLVAMNNRLYRSTAFLEDGTVSTPGAIFARSNGQLNYGNTWTLNDAANGSWNPNREIAAQTSVQAITQDLHTRVPYYTSLIGTRTSTGALQRTPFGGADMQHSIRERQAILACLLIGTNTCRLHLEVMTNLYQAMRQGRDPLRSGYSACDLTNRQLGNGNILINELRSAERDACFGFYGSALGRDKTQAMFLSVATLMSEELSLKLRETLDLFSNVIRTSFGPLYLMRSHRPYDPRDISAVTRVIENGVTRYEISAHGMMLLALLQELSHAGMSVPQAALTPGTNLPQWEEEAESFLRANNFYAQSVWEGTFAASFLTELLSLVKDSPLLEIPAERLRHVVTTHYHHANNSCSPSTDSEQCGFDATSGKYQWVRISGIWNGPGTPYLPLPSPLVHLAAGSSSNATLYYALGALPHSYAHEAVVEEGYATYERVVPNLVDITQSSVPLNTYTAASHALAQRWSE